MDSEFQGIVNMWLICHSPDVEPRPPTCGPGKFRCDDGACIDDDYRCDEVTDCRDGSDERYCDGPPAANGM